MVRTRIAPSPTGADVHVGSVATALMNYAWAKKNKGQFVIRIEDTDRTRIVEGGEAQMLSTLNRIGLIADESPEVGGPYSPYRQSERLPIYKKYAEEHLKLYNGYVNKYNEIQEKLSLLKDEDYTKANQVFSNIRELKVELSFAWGGVVNHEIYFSHLGGKGKAPVGALLSQIEKDFGSFDAFKKDLKATAISARGWVWTGWNHMEERLVNYLGDSQNTFSMWGVTPIVALDTYEHAYFIDYGANRGGYIDSFFENLDWKAVEENFEELVGCCGEECQCE